MPWSPGECQMSRRSQRKEKKWCGFHSGQGKTYWVRRRRAVTMTCTSPPEGSCASGCAGRALNGRADSHKEEEIRMSMPFTPDLDRLHSSSFRDYSQFFLLWFIIQFRSPFPPYLALHLHPFSCTLSQHMSQRLALNQIKPPWAQQHCHFIKIKAQGTQAQLQTAPSNKNKGPARAHARVDEPDGGGRKRIEFAKLRLSSGLCLNDTKVKSRRDGLRLQGRGAGTKERKEEE